MSWNMVPESYLLWMFLLTSCMVSNRMIEKTLPLSVAEGFCIGMQTEIWEVREKENG